VTDRTLVDDLRAAIDAYSGTQNVRDEDRHRVRRPEWSPKPPPAIVPLLRRCLQELEP
jgi:hypothetical protein